MTARKYEIDMCSGAILPKMLRFAMPLMLSGVLQLFFNAADIVVVGRFTGKEALAAVGSTGALINLLINVFMGLSVGANVLVARYIGAKDERGVHETVHTAILISLLCGTGMIFIGLFAASPLLHLMGTPPDVLSQAVLYMRIYFLSMPALMLYNFGSAILRAVGDTRRPLYFLTIAGVINVVLNLIFVIALNWGVAGVAAATSISQAISAVMVLLCLVREKGVYRVDLRALRIHGRCLREMLRIGIPAGVQGSLFALSNTLIQSSINSFGSVTMAACAAASNIEGFVWTAMNSIAQASLSFTSQNLGAQRFSRINHISVVAVGVVSVMGMLLGGGATLFGHQLLSLYNPDPEVIAIGMERLKLIALPYFVCGIMDVMSCSMRGLGYSMLPTLVSLTGACGFRILWICTVFRWYPTLTVLLLSYLLSWAITGAVHILCFFVARRRFPKEDIPMEQFVQVR